MTTTSSQRYSEITKDIAHLMSTKSTGTIVDNGTFATIDTNEGTVNGKRTDGTLSRMVDKVLAELGYRLY